MSSHEFLTSPVFWYLMIGSGGLFLLAGVAFVVLRTRRRPAVKPKGRTSLFARPTRQPADADEAFMREHSMLPYAPENAGGSSDPFMEGSTIERRSAPRRKGNPISVILSDAKGEVDPVDGVIVDRSTTGLALEIWDDEGQVSPGTIISVRPRKSQASITWTPVIVRRCQKVRAGWVLGCEFVRPPGSHTMMEFG